MGALTALAQHKNDIKQRVTRAQMFPFWRKKASVYLFASLTPLSNFNDECFNVIVRLCVKIGVKYIWKEIT